MFRKLFPKRVNARSVLSELAADVWAIDESLASQLNAVIAKVTAADVTDLRAAEQAEEESVGTHKIEDGVAHIPVDGLLVSRGAALFRYFGIAATGYDEISAGIDRAKKDDVESVVLHVSSPGGSVSGLQATASRVFALRKSKQVRSHATRQAASAAYWLGSQAEHFTAEEGTKVGSIGVYAVLEDSSKAFENAGVKVHVVRSGEHKGVGEPGTPISDRQLKKFQRSVDRSADEFKSAIGRGRDLKRSDVETLATGETWSAKDAADLRLIDEVTEIEEIDLTNPAQEAPEEGQEAGMDLEKFKAEILEATDRKLETVQASHAEEIAKKEAELAAANAAIEGIKEGQKQEAIEAAAADGRVTPALRDQVEALAKATDLDGLKSFLGGLPRQVEPEQIGSSSTSSEPAPIKFDDKTVKIRRSLQLAEDKAAVDLDDVIGSDINGNLVMRDGSVKPAQEVLN